MNIGSNPVAPTAVDIADSTDKWLSEHPEGTTFDESAAPELDATKLPLPLDTDDEESEEDVTPPEDETEGETEEAPEGELVGKKTPAPEVKPPEPIAEKTAEPIKPSFAPEDKLGLAEGVEWTRQQVVDALQERVQLQERVKDIDTFQEVFRMPASQAKEIWGPVIDKLVSDPTIGTFLAGYLDDPARKAYLDQCASYYDTENPAPPVAAAVPVAQIPPDVQKQLNDLTKFRQEQEKRDSVARFNNEVEQVRARYPFVVADPALFNDLRETARLMWQQDNSRGLLDAMHARSAVYEALSAARTAQETQPLQGAPETPSAAALPTRGAGPTTKRTQRRQRNFNDLDEATEAWLSEYPDDFKE